MDDGRLKSRAAASNIRERQALANAMYVAEGGRLVATRRRRSVSGSFSLPSCVDDEIEANGHRNVDRSTFKTLRRPLSAHGHAAETP
jgi:hypothetical protein